MTKLNSIPVSKKFNEASNQDETAYSDFIDQINLVLEQDLFSILDKDLFEEKVNFEIKRKRHLFFTTLSLVIALFVIVLLAIVLFGFEFFENDFKNKFVKGVIMLVVGAAFTGIWFYRIKLISDYHSLDPESLALASSDPKKAKILLDWVQYCIDSNERFFLQDNHTKKIYKFSETLPNTRNNLESLIGNHHHRNCLGINGHIPLGPILYLNNHEEEIFKPLKDAIETLNTQTQDLDNPPPEKPELDLNDVIDTKIKKQKETNHKLLEPQRKRIPRRHRHIQTALLKEKMCKLVVKKFQKPAFYNDKIKSKGTRIEWFRTLSIISENPEQWKTFFIDPEKWITFSQDPERWKTFSKNQTDEKNKEDEEIIKFTKKLFGPTGLNTKKRTRQLNFIYGENHYLNHLIKETGVIPEDELVPQSTTLKKKKRNLI